MSAISLSGQLGITTLIINAGPVVKLVLLILFLLSVICWGVIILKVKTVRKAKKDSEEFLNIFWEMKHLDSVSSAARDFESCPVAKVFRAGHMELLKAARKNVGEESRFSATRVEMIERAMRREESASMAGLERHLNILATTGSAAPFIGLFGTVWGIMNSFQHIGAMGSASLAIVAPGVSEALIATAMGLAAAIPAVIAYNTFVEHLRQLSQETDNLILEFLNISERGLRKQANEDKS
jgi:biopolymer transport protein TolQ